MAPDFILPDTPINHDIKKSDIDIIRESLTVEQDKLFLEIISGYVKNIFLWEQWSKKVKEIIKKEEVK